jgi:hypothetical protein
LQRPQPASAASTGCTIREDGSRTLHVHAMSPIAQSSAAPGGAIGASSAIGSSGLKRPREQ